MIWLHTLITNFIKCLLVITNFVSNDKVRIKTLSARLGWQGNYIFTFCACLKLDRITWRLSIFLCSLLNEVITTYLLKNKRHDCINFVTTKSFISLLLSLSCFSRVWKVLDTEYSYSQNISYWSTLKLFSYFCEIIISCWLSPDIIWCITSCGKILMK